MKENKNQKRLLSYKNGWMRSQHLYPVPAESESLSVLAVENEIAEGSGSPTSNMCAPDISVRLFFFGTVF